MLLNPIKEGVKSIRRYLKNIRRLLLNEPPPHLSCSASIIGKADLNVDQQLEKLLGNSGNNLIFVVGEWGSGKTTHVREFMKSHRTGYVFSERSFFSVSTLSDGYLHLISFRRKVISSVIFLCLFLFLYSKAVGLLQRLAVESDLFSKIITVLTPIMSLHLVESVFVLGVAYIFLTNKIKAFYIFDCFLDLVFFVLTEGYSILRFQKLRRRVMVLEDLDRSSMKREDQWALLANLWHWNQSYIVTYGYLMKSQHLLVIEMAEKLSGKVVSLPINGAVNLAIAKNVYPEFPFNGGEWLGAVSPREIIMELGNISRDLGGMDPGLKCRTECIMRMFQLLKAKLLTEVDAGSLFHSFNNGRIEVAFVMGYNPATLSAKTKLCIASFGRSIYPKYVSELQTLYTNDEKNRSTNWFDSEIYHILGERTDKRFIDRLAAVKEVRDEACIGSEQGTIR